MLKYSISLVVVLMLLVSCKTTSVLQGTHINTTQHIPLGGIGLDKAFLLQKEFNAAALPNYTAPIKVSTAVVPFTKTTHKNYVKAKALQNTNVTINYIDSLPEKPTYIKLQLADKVEVINTLNNEDNLNVKNYLLNNKAANVVTSLNLALNKTEFDAITQANSVFLIEASSKHYALKLYYANSESKRIEFNQGVVFGYQTAHCCWKENKQLKLNIVDFVDAYSSCPNKSYRSANKAKKNRNYYKL